MNLKRVVCSVLSLIMVIGMFCMPASATSGVKVVLNGKEISFDVQPQIINGRTMVPMRAIFEVLGIQDVVAKSLGSNNPYNMIKATFNALESINSPRMVAAKRGKKVGDIVSRRENSSNAKLDKEEA
jgi:hypothetical protein